MDYHSRTAVKEVIALLQDSPLAGTLAIGAGSLAAAIKIATRVSGSGRISAAQPAPATNFRGALARRRGVSVTSIWGGSLRANEVGPGIDVSFLPGALATGTYRPAPQATVVGEGLESIPIAIQQLKQGVSAMKLVVTISVQDPTSRLQVVRAEHPGTGRIGVAGLKDSPTCVRNSNSYSLILGDMERGYAEYMPLRPGKPRRRRRILRTAKLNIVGGAALLGSCLTAAGLGFATGRFLGLPVAVTASAGGLLPLALLAVVDRRRWRASLAAYGWGGTADEVAAVASALLRRGVVANVEIQVEDDHETASLCYRNADVDVVSTVLAEHGLPAIDPYF